MSHVVFEHPDGVHRLEVAVGIDRGVLAAGGARPLLRPVGGKPCKVWARDVVDPIDVVFVGVYGRILAVARDLSGAQTAPFAVPQAVAWWLELPAGRAAALGLHPGQVARRDDEPPPRPRRVVVIVDPLRVGSSLARELVAGGAVCLGVYGAPGIDRSRTDRAVFERVFVHTGDLAETVARLRPYGPDAVVPATETGVRLADALAYAFGLDQNVWALREARRDKFEMIEALHRAGLHSARQIGTASPEAAIVWRRDAGIGEVVVKPLDSAGSDGVAICADDDEIRRAFAALLGRTHQLGNKVERVVVQERLIGDEYITNAVSLGGHHRFADQWRYRKRPLHGSPVMYDTNELLDPNDPIAATLRAYTSNALDALGVRFGPTHAEVILTAQGPALIEVGARFAGVTAVEVWRECLGTSCVDLVAQSLLDPVGFRAGPVAPPRLLRHSRSVYLYLRRSGLVAAVPGRERLRALASYRALFLNANEGTRAIPSKDVFSAGGVVLLTHEDPAVIAADRDRARALDEAELLFDIRDASESDVVAKFAARTDVHQSPGFRRLMVALGWRLIDVGGDVGYARQFADGWFVKVLRARRFDPARVAAVQAKTPASWAIEPALRWVRPDGREHAGDAAWAAEGYVASSRSWSYGVTLVRPVGGVPAPDAPLATVGFSDAPADVRDAALALRGRTRGGHRVELLAAVPDAFGEDGWFHTVGGVDDLRGVAWVVLHDGVACCLDLHVDPRADFGDVRADLLRAALAEAERRGADLFDLGGGSDADAAREGWTTIAYPAGVRPPDAPIEGSVEPAVVGSRPPD